MKKALSLVLVLLLLLSLCACGSNDAKNTEPATTTCSHAWKDATCTAPKTCSKCGATEGSAAGHTYAEGACTVCKTPDPNVYFTDNIWTAQIVRPGDAKTGEVLSMYSLMATDFQGYAHKDYYANAVHIAAEPKIVVGLAVVGDLVEGLTLAVGIGIIILVSIALEVCCHQ